MKRQMKIAAVVSATALLAIGASFTSMAAAKTGNWTQGEDGAWYCYDKNDDMYTNEFCMSNGVELYVGDDGAMVTNSWVEYDGNMYYIGSAGTKTVNNWKLLTPFEDEDAEEEWYWFGSTGKRTQDKKVAINGETFYFDGEGKVIYGWVDTVNFEQAEADDALTSIVYTNERGARVTSDWVKTYAPGINVDEIDLDTVSPAWYYLKSLGNPVSGKQSSIDGETYLFTKAGKMLSGWIAYDATNEEYISIDDEEDTVALGDLNMDVYYACTEDGHVKKNKWIKEWNNLDFYEADPDVDKNWYWIGKDGKVFMAGTNATDSNAVSFTEGVLVSKASHSNVEFKAINNEIYAFNEDGKMQSGLIETAAGMYYFGGKNDGARKTGAQTIADNLGDNYKFYFGTEDDNGYKKGVAVTGAKNSKLYKKGLLQTTANELKYDVVEVGGKKYIINNNGSIMTSKQAYYDDGEFIVNAKAASFETKAGVEKGSVTGHTYVDPKAAN